MSDDKEFYDLCYDVWRSGGNPDLVDKDRFNYEYDDRYDFVLDENILQRELYLQHPKVLEGDSNGK